jgi:hypothetical protein
MAGAGPSDAHRLRARELLMRWLLVLSVLIGAAALPPDAARGQSTIAATAVEHTTFGEVSARTLADRWGLQPDEITRYRDYMAVEGRYFYSHLDPVMVLGLIETEPARRARYAEKYVLAERRRIEQQTGFATLVAAMQLKRFGLEPPVDFARLPLIAAIGAFFYAEPVEITLFLGAALIFLGIWVNLRGASSAPQGVAVTKP